MPIDDVRVRLRRKLEEAFGAEEASILMDRPPGGWTDLVTNQTFDLKMDALRAEIVGRASGDGGVERVGRPATPPADDRDDDHPHRGDHAVGHAVTRVTTPTAKLRQ